ncbi:hypothetical protein KP509_13G022200 [Ceratopteris richardii]|uniref:Large ribosomal subunit protein uL18c n=1 Tax=Ceratopteris richardii TaxID=49495 RepID=A0A8T2TE13_CERRI|nr:hypothetical protein KP509_13G022200 [Ceratopteris richardii]
MVMATTNVGVNLSFAAVLSDPALKASSTSVFPLSSRQTPCFLQSIEAKKQPSRRETIQIRHTRIRKKLSGTSERPRLAVFRSNQHMYAQVIDDTKGFTLASASTIQKSMREELELTSGPTLEAAKKVGEEVAKACLAKGISKVAFDRGGFVYHGRIKALADSAREHGLDF